MPSQEGWKQWAPWRTPTWRAFCKQELAHEVRGWLFQREYVWERQRHDVKWDKLEMERFGRKCDNGKTVRSHTLQDVNLIDTETGTNLILGKEMAG